jgi:Uncharacterized enzyme of phosphonate metabolism
MNKNNENLLKSSAKPKPLKEALIKGVSCLDWEELERMQRLIERSEVIIRQEPRTALIMMTVKDCFDTPFHLGEVLVTTAEVDYSEHHGYGLVIGDEPEKALLLACVEAIELGDDWKLKNELEELIAPLRERAEAKQLQSMKLAGSTQVSFESMAQE